MDDVLNLLISAHGETLGRLIFGAYRTADAAVALDRARKEAEAKARAPKPKRAANVTPLPSKEAGADTA